MNFAWRIHFLKIMSLKLSLCVTISYLQIRRPCLNPFQSCLDLEIRFRQSFVIEHNIIHITYSAFESLFIKINSYLVFTVLRYFVPSIFIKKIQSSYLFSTRISKDRSSDLCFLHFLLDYWHDFNIF